MVSCGSMNPANAPKSEKKTKNTKIRVTLMSTRGRIMYGMTVAPSLPMAELNPKPKVLFSVP